MLNRDRRLFFCAYLTGKLHESMDLFKIRVQADQEIRDKLLPKLPNRAQSALRRLNAHFGGGNSSIPDVRNKLAFHNRDDEDLIEQSFQTLPSEEVWDFFLAPSIANTFYHASELVMTQAAIGLVRAKGDNAVAFDRLLKDITQVAGWIGDLFGEIIAEIAGKLDVPTEEHDIPDPLKLSEIYAPFFLDEDDLRVSRDELRAKTVTT